MESTESEDDDSDLEVQTRMTKQTKKRRTVSLLDMNYVRKSGI